MRIGSLAEMFRPRLPHRVWILSITNLLADTSAEMIRSVLPIFVLLKFQSGALTVGEIEGISAITLAVMRVFSGGLSDYLGMQKGLAVIGYGISTLTRPLLAIATNNPLWLICTQCGDRFGEGVSIAPRKALMADITDRDLRSEAYRLRQSLLIAGTCIGSIIAGAILFFSRNDYRLVFAGAVTPACMALALLIVAVQPIQKQRKLLTIPAEMTKLVANSDEFYHRNSTQLQASSTTQSYSPIYWRDLGYLGGEYWLLLIVAVFFNLGNSSDAFLLMRSVEINVPPAFIPIGLVIMNLVFALAAYPISAVVNRALKVRLLLAGFLLHIIVYFELAVVSDWVRIWGLFALYGLHLAMTHGLLLDLVDRAVDPARRVTAVSLFNLAIGIALLIANLIAGWCWQSFGSGVAFAIGAFFACIATLILLIGSEE